MNNYMSVHESFSGDPSCDLARMVTVSVPFVRLNYATHSHKTQDMGRSVVLWTQLKLRCLDL